MSYYWIKIKNKKVNPSPVALSHFKNLKKCVVWNGMFQKMECFLLVNSACSVHISLLIQTGWFSHDKAILWIVNTYLAWSNGLKLKCLDGFISYEKTAFCFTRHSLLGWSGVDYLCIIVMFLSAYWTLILTAPIHCRGSIGEQVMQCYISPNQFWPCSNWMAWGQVNLSKCSFWGGLFLQLLQRLADQCKRPIRLMQASSNLAHSCRV